LIRPVFRRIGERSAVILGLSIDVVAFIALGFVTNGWIALALTPLTALGSIAGPALQGIMSRAAEDNQQGELQGVIASLNAVATIVAPLLLTQTFWFFTAPENPIYLPGAPFLLSAILTLGCILVFRAARRTIAEKLDG
jgi:DHA1 family tetracycline resistance protein-like MFS transporter